MELFGRGYVFDHCVAEIKKKSEEKACRVYVTDALKCIAENTSRFAGGSSMRSRWYDAIHPAPEDTRTGDEIAADVISRAGLKQKGGE